ncbi:tRNA synthetases class II family protein [Mycobacterium xenopi 4042]|uniref:alanine--tRNA ligase n=1 Tax=Mycobacterium xenopi 4042 TaxID=1299334 RepID=X7ZJ66_MYCXE|nr:tRNA synthetases class II family protein [Mycobacterium xenopi 4042]
MWAVVGDLLRPRAGVRPEGGPVVSEDRYIELWNLVFMESERGEGTKDEFEIIGSLPRKNIDTGMGVERVACVLQGVPNVYETDLLRPVIDTVAARAPRPYGNHGTPKMTCATASSPTTAAPRRS